MTEQEDFERNIKDHVMEVIRDDGLYRHLRFRQPGTMCMHFDLVTWPGYLCYTGDMGTYVFTRTTDMLEFFRRPEHCRYSIDMRYWAEKVVAGDKSGSGDGVKEFSPEKFTQVVNQYRVQWIREAKQEGTLDREERRELWAAVQEEVLDRLTEGGEHAASTAAYEFSHHKRGHDERGPSWYFQDFFEHDFTIYTHRFQWCCQALSWAVQKYDQAKQEQPA